MSLELRMFILGDSLFLCAVATSLGIWYEKRDRSVWKRYIRGVAVFCVGSAVVCGYFGPSLWIDVVPYIGLGWVLWDCFWRVQKNMPTTGQPWFRVTVGLSEPVLRLEQSAEEPFLKLREQTDKMEVANKLYPPHLRPVSEEEGDDA